MALHLVHFEHQGRARWGVIREGRITPVPADFATTGEFLRGTTLGELSQLSGPSLAETEVRLLSPVTRNQQFICLGANYRQHMIESGMNPDDKKYNMVSPRRPVASCPRTASCEARARALPVL